MHASVYVQFLRRRIVDKPTGIVALKVTEAKIKTKTGIETGIGIARSSKRNSRKRVRTTFQSTITRIV